MYVCVYYVCGMYIYIYIYVYACQEDDDDPEVGQDGDRRGDAEDVQHLYPPETERGG